MISLETSAYEATLRVKSIPKETDGVYASFGKRLFDLTVAILATIFLLSWLIPILGIIICLTSPGPPLFIQVRTGRNGRPFRCFKFRTMSNRQNTEFRQATENDPRVTPIGRILRKTNLDEMPQFLNVIMGDMSIVGPRPHAVQHDAQFWSMPGYRERYEVRPGITGVAQTRGCRGETAQLIQMQHRVRLDHWYIGRYSLGLDCKVCWWTVEKMWKGDKNAH